MKTKFLVFEYLIALFFALQVLLPDFFTWIISAITFLFLIVLKYRYEGLRVTFFVYILIQTGLLIFSNSIANMTLTLLTYFILTYFPIFEFPESKGPFLVGYKDLTISKNVQVSVFYPTLQQGKKVMYKTSENGWVRIYDIMRSYPGHFIPSFVYRICLGFLDFIDIGVNLEAKIISPNLLSYSQKFPVVVFSHGLSANRNLYTGFARQWASYGYIVFCVDHDEQIYVEFKGFDDYKQKRGVHLEDRVRTISQVLDFIYSPKEVKKLFQTSIVELDYQRVSLAGHSFGCCAVAHTASQDSRITGALVLLDPWLFPADDKILEMPANRPVLVLRSESFANIIEEFHVKERIQKYVQANRKYRDQTISCYFKNSTHNSFCDLIVHMPREMKLFGIIEDTKDVEEIYNCQTMMSQIFLDLMLYSTTVSECGTKKELVLRAFDSYLSDPSVKKSTLEVDHF